MQAPLTHLAFEFQPEATVIVAGDKIEHRNRAWTQEVGESASLSDCFQASVREAVAQARENAKKAPVTLKARLASGRSAKLSFWPAGEEAVALRLEKDHEPAPAAPTTDEILASYEKTLQWLFRHIDSTLWTTRRDGVITVSHGLGLARHGIAEGQMVGVNAFEAFPSDSEHNAVARRVLAGESIHELHNDGRVLWNRFLVPMHDEKGEVAAMVGFSTAVPPNAQDLKHSNRLIDILNVLPIVVWAMKSDGTCTLSLGEQLKSFGFAPGELVGQNLFEVYKDVPDYINRIGRALAGESFIDEVPFGDRVFTAHYLPEKNFRGEVVGMYAVVQDITALRRAEQEVRVQEGRIASQERVLAEVVSPIIEVWQGVLVVPLIGGLDPKRAALLTEKLLADVVRRGSSFAILDVTGVDAMDEATAAHLIQIMRSVALLGSTCLVSGIRSSVAQTMVALGTQMPAQTFPTLAAALQHCLRRARATR